MTAPSHGEPAGGSIGARVSALVRRGVDESPAVRRVIKHPVSQHVIRLERTARVLSPRSRFLIGELRGATGTYRVPSGSIVVVRHRSRDLDIVCDIFGATGGRLDYEPPPSIAGRLEGRPLRILDVGGNVGLFGAFALGRWPVASLVSFEPDPVNAELLQATIAHNHAAERWTLESVAVSNANGTMTFVSGAFSESRFAEPDEAGIDVEVTDLFERAPDVDLIKLDIEGGEWPLLADPRMAALRAPVLVMEWHQRFCPERDGHAAAVALLQRAGYVIELDAPGVSNGLIWAQRPVR